jgi:hypothetical protein
MLAWSFLGILKATSAEGRERFLVVLPLSHQYDVGTCLIVTKVVKSENQLDLLTPVALQYGAPGLQKVHSVVCLHSIHVVSFFPCLCDIQPT